MRILIDGSVFAEERRKEEAVWWHGVLPLIREGLSHHTILFLNRTQSPVFPEYPEWCSLFASAPDYVIWAIEDRRLAALCRELTIDVFLSTSDTSAVAEVATLYVLPGVITRSLPCGSEGVSLALAETSALALTSACLSFAETYQASLSALEHDTYEFVRETRSENLQTAAKTIVGAIEELGGCVGHEASRARRTLWVTKVCQESERLKKEALEKAMRAHELWLRQVEAQDKRSRVRRALSWAVKKALKFCGHIR